MKEETKAQRIRRLRKEASLRDCSLPSIASALEFRREAYDLTATEFAGILGLQKSHYSEIIHGKRDIPRDAMRRAFLIGVPARVLLTCS